MITYQRDPMQQTIPISSVKVIGLGGAGANMLEHVARNADESAELLALNTDVRTLNACIAGEKIQLGTHLTKGLGCGGDPELGQQAVLEAEDAVRASLRGRRIVFLCVGLGGGTGSGAAPVVARIAREEGAFVVVFASMPFSFEGRRRREQAETALNELAVLSNALVTFDNNRMGELVLGKQGIHEAFAAADRMICESIMAVTRLVVRPGLINVGLDDLMSALRTNRSRCLFGSGMAKGKDRAVAALRKALSSPLLDQGALLKEARTVLVHLCGGEDLTLYEVELMMRRLSKYVPESAHVLFGAATSPNMGDALSITLISALPEDALANAPREEERLAADEILAPSGSFTLPDGPEEEADELESPFSIAEPEEGAEERPAPARKPDLEAAAAEISSLFADEPFADEGGGAEERGTEPSTSAVFTSAASAVDPEEDFTVVDDDADYAGGGAAEEVKLGSFFEDGPEPAADDQDPDERKPARKVGAFTLPERKRDFTSVLRPWKKERPAQEPPAGETPPPPQEGGSATRLKLGGKGQTAGQGDELELGDAPRGRFEGQEPDIIDGEDLDIPPFLRKKRK